MDVNNSRLLINIDFYNEKQQFIFENNIFLPPIFELYLIRDGRQQKKQSG